MKTIEIRVPELGQAVGTTSWVAPKLEQIQNSLKVGKTKDGCPCLTYQHWDEKPTLNNKGEWSKPRHVLCFISKTGHFNYHFYDNRIGDVWSVQIENNGDNVYLFPALSDKAKEVVNEFLDSISQKFWEEYNIN